MRVHIPYTRSKRRRIGRAPAPALVCLRSRRRCRLRIIDAVTFARAAIADVLFGGPVVLGFFSGGYFDRPRLWAGIMAWVCVALAACMDMNPWPRTRAAWLALGGLAALTLWTIVSIEWTPLRDQAQADAQRAALYLGTVVVGVAVLRQRRAARAVEPALAFGAVIVICYGLSERVLPGVFTLAQDASAGGRLSQPLTYWNAMGIVAAMGFVLLVRLAGDPSRSRRLRLAAVVAGPPVALGLYLTLSRGGLLAVAIGLALLALLAPTREQARAMVLMLVAALPAIVAGGALSSVRTLHGSLGSREVDGLVVLCLLVVSMTTSAAAMEARLRRPARGSLAGALDLTIRRIASAGCLVIALATVVVFISAAASRVNINLTQATNTTSTRLVTTDTIRGNFWSVALSAFVNHPLRGLGAGGFETEWGRQRTVLYYAHDAHSLYLETLSELGIVGGLALLALLAGVVGCARRAYQGDPGLSAGWIAAVGMWAVHAGLDWDWEMPAVALLVFVLVAAILVQADAGPSAAPSAVVMTPAAEVAPVSAGVKS